MLIEVEWHKPVLLSKNSRIVVDRNNLPASIPKNPASTSSRVGMGFLFNHFISVRQRTSGAD